MAARMTPAMCPLPDQAPMVSVGNEEPAAIVTKLRQALAAADRLSSERAALEEALKVRALQGLLSTHHGSCYMNLTRFMLYEYYMVRDVLSLYGSQIVQGLQIVEG